MIDELKRIWSGTPWYLKLGLIVFVPLFLVEKGMTWLATAQQAIRDGKVDAKVAALKQQEASAAISVAESEGKIQELEAEKQKIQTEKETDDVSQYLSSYHPPTDSK